NAPRGAGGGARPCAGSRLKPLLQGAGWWGGSVDAELLELVAQGAEGDAQGGGGLGLVVAVFLQGLLDGGAFDLLDVGGQGAAGGVEGAGLARVGAGRGIDRRRGDRGH